MNFGEKMLSRLLYPRQIEDYVQLFNPIWSSDRILGQVIEVRQQTTDCTSLVLKVNSNWTSCTAGQYAMITPEINGKKYSRMFTISEHSRETVTFTVKRNGDGIVSNWINNDAKVNDIIEISEPQGDFVLDTTSQKPVIMVAGGSGITPFWAMLQDMRELASKRPVSLLYYTPTKEETIYYDELTELSKQMFNVELTVVHIVDESDNHKLFCANSIENLAVKPQDADIFVCGPSPLISAVEKYCDENGLSDSFNKEYFVPPAPEVSVEDAKVSFSDSGVVVESSSGTLLETAESAGLTPEYGCRMGICQTCTCKKISGQVKNILTGDILDEDGQTIQLCITVPHNSDVVLEL